jgi:hypothetical protein
LAYWTASLSRSGKLPNFDNWMNPPKPARGLKGDEADERRRQHDEDVARIEEMLAAQREKKEQNG